MGSPFGNGHAIDAGIALAITSLMLAVYCWVQWHAQANYRMLIAGVTFVIHGLVFLVVGIVLQHNGQYKSAYAMFICCKGISVLAIWSFLVVCVLYPIRALGSTEYIFWGGLAAQIVFISLGLWKVVSSRLEFIWATPVVTNITISAILGYALASYKDKRPMELWVWLMVGMAISATSLVIAACQLVQGEAPIQCFLGGIPLELQACMHWRKARNGKKCLLHNKARDAPSVSCDANEPPACDSNATLLVNAHARHGYGYESGIELLSSTTSTPTPATISETSLSSSITGHSPFQPTVASPFERPDSGVVVISPPASSNISFSSSVTAGSEVYRGHRIGKMQFPRSPFSVFRVDPQMANGYAAIHAFHRKIDNNRLIPGVVGRPSRILDVGAGTDEWASDVKGDQPQAQVLCTDLFPIQSLLNTSQATLYVEDANQSDWGWPQDRFDYIHFRNLDGGIRDWGTAFKAAFSCLEAGGFLGLEDLIFYQPPRNLAPDSIWHDWQQALDCLQHHSGMSFGVHDKRYAQNSLMNSGYKIISENRRQFNIRRGDYVFEEYDLLWSIIELMKGVLARAWEIQPPEVDKQFLMDRVDEELGHGLNITVVTVIAQRPPSFPPAPDEGKKEAEGEMM